MVVTDKKLKRAIQLDVDSITTDQIDTFNSIIKTNFALIETCKKEIANVMKTRDKVLRSLLLTRGNYIVEPGDTVVYMDQTQKILIYENTETPDNEGPNETF